MISAKLAVSEGSPVQCNAGDRSSPSQVIRLGRSPPSAKPCTVTLKSALIPLI